MAVQTESVNLFEGRWLPRCGRPVSTCHERYHRRGGDPLRSKGHPGHNVANVAAEEELQRSEFYLADGQRLAHYAIWSFAPSGICDYWSQESYEILGLDPATGIPTIADYLTRVHPEDPEFVQGIINQIVAEGIGCDFKKRIIRPASGL